MATYPNIPVSPGPGEIRYFDSIQPALKQGDYNIQLSQDFRQLNDEGGDETRLMSQKSTAQYFSVAGSQWSIDPLTVHARYPPKNQQGVLLDHTLPKIVFQNKSLPWERSISDTIENEHTPWLGLLLFNDTEFSDGCRVLEEQDTFKMLSNSQETTTPMKIRVLSVDQTLLDNIAPSLRDLPYLAHGLQVNPKDKELCGSDEDGIFSVVLANRVPTESDKTYHVCLVSLEGQEDNLPSPQIILSGGYTVDPYSNKKTKVTNMPAKVPSYDYNASSATNFVLLDNWSFQTGDGGDFESRMKTLQFRRSHDDSERVGSLGDMVDHATKEDFGIRYEPALLGSEMDPDVTINSFVQTEITEHDGLSRPCLYRSPAVAVPVEHEPKIEPYVNSDDARGLELSLDMDVIHHSAAFELGRLLALSDPKFIQTLSLWRHERLHRKSQILKIEEFAELNPDLGLKVDELRVDLKMHDLIQRDIITKVSEKLTPVPMDPSFDPAIDPRINPRTEGEVIELIDTMIESNIEMLDVGFADTQLRMPHAENAQRYGVR